MFTQAKVRSAFTWDPASRQKKVLGTCFDVGSKCLAPSQVCMCVRAVFSRPPFLGVIRRDAKVKGKPKSSCCPLD